MTYLNKVAADTIPKDVQNAMIMGLTIGILITDDPGALSTFTEIRIRR